MQVLASVAKEGLANAEDLLNTSGGDDLPVQSHRTWRRWLRRPPGTVDPVRCRQQPVVLWKDFKARLKPPPATAPASRYEAQFNDVTLCGVNTRRPRSIRLEMRLGMSGGSDVCVVRSNFGERHVPMSLKDTIDRTASVAFTETNVVEGMGPNVLEHRRRPVRFDCQPKTLEWRGPDSDLKDKYLQIILWEKTGWFCYEQLALQNVLLDQLATGSSQITLTLPVAQEEAYQLRMRVVFAEVFVFELVVHDLSVAGLATDGETTYKVSLQDASKGRTRGLRGGLRLHEAAVGLLSGDTAPDDETSAENQQWCPNQTSKFTTETTLVDVGRLFWRGTMNEFMSDERDFRLVLWSCIDKQRVRKAEWPFSGSMFAGSDSYRFNDVLMTDGVTRISGVIGVPRYPQCHQELDGNGSQTVLSFKILSFTGAAPTDLWFTCVIAKTEDDESPGISVMSSVKKGIRLSLRELRHKPDKNSSEQLNVAFVESHALVIYVWHYDERERAVDEIDLLGSTLPKVLLGHCSISFTELINQLRDTEESVVKEFALPLLRIGHDSKSTGIMLNVGFSLSFPLTRVPPLEDVPAGPPAGAEHTYINELGQPESLQSALKITSLPLSIDHLSPYDVAKTIRLTKRSNAYFLGPHMCAFTGIGNTRDVALLTAALHLFRRHNAFLGCGLSAECLEECWFVLLIDADGTRNWWLPGTWKLETSRAPLNNAFHLTCPTPTLITNDLPSFLHSIKFLLNTERVVSGLGELSGETRPETAVRARPRPKTRGLLMSLRTLPLEDNDELTNEDNLREVARFLSIRANEAAKQAAGCRWSPAMAEALKFVLTNDLEAQSSLTAVLACLYETFSTPTEEFKLDCYEAPSADPGLWQAILGAAFTDAKASVFGTAFRIQPCTFGSRVSVKCLVGYVTDDTARAFREPECIQIANKADPDQQVQDLLRWTLDVVDSGGDADVRV